MNTASELTMILLRTGLLLALWFFVYLIVRVVRKDVQVVTVAAPGPAPVEPSQPHLLVTAGSLKGTRLPLGSVAILIGRAPTCSLVLEDDFASAKHARIYQSGDGKHWYVEDLGSTNGTYVNNEKITEPVELEPSTRVRIGQSVIQLQR